MGFDHMTKGVEPAGSRHERSPVCIPPVRAGMSIVLAVAEAGSLSAAARRLNTPPATASRKIAELEEHLRAKLFDRSARKLTLTDSGLSYVEALKRILADLSEADHAAAGEYTKPTGELIVTAPVSLG